MTKIYGMKLEDAQKIIDIMSTADGGCSTCFSGLSEKFFAAFPQFSRGEKRTYTVQPDWSDDPEDAAHFDSITVLEGWNFTGCAVQGFGAADREPHVPAPGNPRAGRGS